MAANLRYYELKESAGVKDSLHVHPKVLQMKASIFLHMLVILKSRKGSSLYLSSLRI